jgi:peptide deformylase
MCISNLDAEGVWPVVAVDPEDLECAGSILRIRSTPVRQMDIDVERLVEKMLKVLYSVPHGRGLSAVQIGVPAQVFVVNIDRVPGKEIIMIDPEVVSTSGRLVRRSEGCMSLPNYKGDLKRRNAITVKGKNIRGQDYIVDARGYEANVIMHELDHLEGVLYWDRMPKGSKPQHVDRLHVQNPEKANEIDR